MQHFLDLWNLDADQIEQLLDNALHLKQELQRGQRPPLLAGRVLGLVFEKPSLRTRASFEAAMAQMGGSSIFLSSTDGALGVRESVPDFARTLSQYTDVIAARVNRHQTLVELAAYSRCPVINALSDVSHPCQALGDLLTVKERFGAIRGRTLVFVGDSNNVARSLAIACGKLGASFVLASPDGYGFDDSFLRAYHQRAMTGTLMMNGEPHHAVHKADVIYTDVWTSMGQEAERSERLLRFQGYQVNSELLKRAPAHAVVMHCLPAKRGEEVTDDVLDGEHSIAFEQAGNRMHVQKALLHWLLTRADSAVAAREPATT